MKVLRRGVTALNATGMYTGEDRDVLLCADHPATSQTPARHHPPNRSTGVYDRPGGQRYSRSRFPLRRTAELGKAKLQCKPGTGYLSPVCRLQAVPIHFSRREPAPHHPVTAQSAAWLTVVCPTEVTTAPVLRSRTMAYPRAKTASGFNAPSRADRPERRCRWTSMRCASDASERCARSSTRWRALANLATGERYCNLRDNCAIRSRSPRTLASNVRSSRSRCCWTRADNSARSGVATSAAAEGVGAR